MIRKEDLPEAVICHICGQPMKVVELSSLARELGCGLTESVFILECCGYEQTFDTAEEATKLRKMIQEYYSQKNSGNTCG